MNLLPSESTNIYAFFYIYVNDLFYVVLLYQDHNNRTLRVQNWKHG
jgi:hypothetical protein